MEENKKSDWYMAEYILQMLDSNKEVIYEQSYPQIGWTTYTVSTGKPYLPKICQRCETPLETPGGDCAACKGSWWRALIVKYKLNKLWRGWK